MKGLFAKLAGSKRPDMEAFLKEEDQIRRQVAALYNLMSNIYGADKLVLKAGKLEAINLMRSSNVCDKVVGLQRLVFEDPTVEKIPALHEVPEILGDIEDEIADIIARRTVEDKLEKKIAERMQQRHEEYVKEIRLQVIREDSGPDNPQTLKKLEDLERLDGRTLMKSATDKLRPASIAEVVGQDRAVKALMAKIATPYPQHVILYGPPGVGKTTVARLAMEQAKHVKHSPFDPAGRFVEVDGTTLRWDPREVTNPLLGSVHDPIYQGARRDLAEGGIPEPKPGLVTDAHGGVLFIDEIGELDGILQSKLLKVLEDKKVAFDSAYYDPDDPNVPKYVHKLFKDGAPADFLLIGATTREPGDISPALRSRCAEVFFEPLTPGHIKTIVDQAADRLGARVESGVSELISEYTAEGRKGTNILADSYGVALHRSGDMAPEDVTIGVADVREVVSVGRLAPYNPVKASDKALVGRIFGLGVSGFMGSVLEIEAVSYPASQKGKGTLRFNDTAGSMAKDSVFNAASVIRAITGMDLAEFDIHVNVVGGGNIDGPSAGVAMVLAIISALKGIPIRQDVAVTGEASIQGYVKAVGGVHEKLFGAKQAGIKTVLIPHENSSDIAEAYNEGMAVVGLSDIREAFPFVFTDWEALLTRTDAPTLGPATTASAGDGLAS